MFENRMHRSALSRAAARFLERESDKYHFYSKPNGLKNTLQAPSRKSSSARSVDWSWDRDEKGWWICSLIRLGGFDALD